LKAVLALQSSGLFPKLVSDERLFDTVNVLLSMQNSDGGFASYELARSGKWMEMLNQAEVFGKIMVEYSYPECTTSVVLGLSSFRKNYPHHRTKEIDDTIDKALRYIKNSQRSDGSWFGSWGICFTYATLFALESLASVGETYQNSTYVQKACHFLVFHQMEDGGWGENYRSCEEGEYIEEKTSQVVNTSWVLLSLMAAKYPNEEVIRKGIKLLLSRQQPYGSYKQEEIEGVFNKSTMIAYPNYKLTFPMWAMARYAKMYDDPIIFGSNESE